MSLLESKYARAQVVLEYKDAKTWPAPLNVCHLAIRLLTFLVHKCVPSLDLYDRGASPGFQFEMSVGDELTTQAQELAALKTCHAKRVKAREKEEAVDTLHELVAAAKESTEVQLESMQRQLGQMRQLLEDRLDRRASVLPVVEVQAAPQKSRPQPEDGEHNTEVPNWESAAES